MNTSVATNAYRSVKRAGISEGSTPHSLIAQLYQGAIDAISALIDNDSQDSQLTQHHTNKGIAIINELQAALHEPSTDEIAGNLFALYAFIVEQLQLFRKNDSSANLHVCKDILTDLQDAWSSIGPNGI
ncbi:MAG: flagellar protein FliS [Gammaproteobacteria bacterium]|nr:flagellar protein FliS [Gammaproteobacteria bacterium]